MPKVANRTDKALICGRAVLQAGESGAFAPNVAAGFIRQGATLVKYEPTAPVEPEPAPKVTKKVTKKKVSKKG